MSRMPDDLKSKYNKDSKFIWVDAQLERMMRKQKELESKLSELKVMVNGTKNLINLLFVSKDKKKLENFYNNINKNTYLLINNL